MEGDKLVVELEKYIKKRKTLTKRDLMTVRPLVSNPLFHTIVNSYTEENTLKFSEMIKDLQMFVSKSEIDDKLRFLFRMYDKDNDGRLSNHDIFLTIESLCDGLLDRKKIQNLVDQIYREYDDCHTIDFGQFKEIIKRRTKNLSTYFKAM
jgi:serine/threonine-protein phosphatase 2B regulatory subunit